MTKEIKITQTKIIGVYLFLMYGAIVLHNIFFGDVEYYMFRPLIFLTDLFIKSGVTFSLANVILVIINHSTVKKKENYSFNKILCNLQVVSVVGLAISIIVFLIFEVWFTFSALPRIYR